MMPDDFKDRLRFQGKVIFVFWCMAEVATILAVGSVVAGLLYLSFSGD